MSEPLPLLELSEEVKALLSLTGFVAQQFGYGWHVHKRSEDRNAAYFVGRHVVTMDQWRATIDGIIQAHA